MTKPFLISSQKHFCFRQTVKLLFITVPWEKKLCLGNFFSKTFLLPVFSTTLPWPMAEILKIYLYSKDIVSEPDFLPED